MSKQHHEYDIATEQLSTNYGFNTVLGIARDIGKGGAKGDGDEQNADQVSRHEHRHTWNQHLPSPQWQADGQQNQNNQHRTGGKIYQPRSRRRFEHTERRSTNEREQEG